MHIEISLRLLEAVFLFVVLSLTTGILNAAGQDLWSWLRRNLARWRQE